jgi:hypothetical protein
MRAGRHLLHAGGGEAVAEEEPRGDIEDAPFDLSRFGTRGPPAMAERRPVGQRLTH